MQDSAPRSGTRALNLSGARSWLFVPADRPDRIAKALAGPADAVIVDLEDAVAAAAKEAARAALRKTLNARQPVVVRVNGLDTEWFAQDLELCRLPGVAGIVVPKAEDAEGLADMIDRIGGQLPVLPLIETALGLWNAHAIARVPGVQRLLFGPLDFQLDLRMSGAAEDLAHFRAQLVLVSRVARIAAPIDGPTLDINDVGAVRADTLRARRGGFGGKLCIHPNQVEVVNKGFLPTAAEVAWAESVVAAAKAAHGAAVKVDGKMVDRPVIDQAERILSQASRGSPS